MTIKYISGQTELNRVCHSLSVLDELAGATKLGMDFEADGLDPYTLHPILLGITDGTTKYVINLLTFEPSHIRQAINKLSSKVLWIAHNMKYDWKLFKVQYGVTMERVWCTQVASQVLYNGMDALRHSLDSVLERHFRVKLDKTARNTFINRDLSEPITDGEINYLCGDLGYLIPLYELQYRKGHELQMPACLDLEMEFLPILAQMELEGIRLDVDAWKQNTRNNARKAEAVHKKILVEVGKLGELFPRALTSEIKKAKKPKQVEDHPFAPISAQPAAKAVSTQLGLFDDAQVVSKKKVAERFNVGSTVQIQALFERCGVNLDSTGEEVLQQYVLNNPASPLAKFIELLLEYRGLIKLVGTYGDKFLEVINPVTGRIHTDFSQAFTDTGRLSSRSPNLQNLPATEEIRSCFIPDSEDYLFVDVDMSGQELRLAASYSQDKMLLASFTEGLDLHSYLAQGSYRIITRDPTLIVSKDVNKKYRGNHKPVLFGVLYGAGPGSIAGTLNIDFDTAKLVYREILRNLPQLAKFQERMKKLSLQTKTVRDGSRYNRIKFFNRFVKKTMEDHQIERQACNFPIQSSGSSMMKEAGIRLARFFKDNNLDCKLKLSVHDEYLVQIPKSQPELGEKIKTIMEEVGSSFLQGVRMESELMVGDHWLH
ncbi:hypothetical protein GCM10028806_33270 [Spirosoma terrae]|uniref:DNA polymerase I n=1 Tax=Spirosoma terrae TaxID=1968276 RepID=A0A6L9L8G9_9BACT|nr:DNA polymerase [Spirosoma terrae]NDU95642.1 hypothetical protein [Spirosoma terrae]